MYPAGAQNSNEVVPDRSKNIPNKPIEAKDTADFKAKLKSEGGDIADDMIKVTPEKPKPADLVLSVRVAEKPEGFIAESLRIDKNPYGDFAHRFSVRYHIPVDKILNNEALKRRVIRYRDLELNSKNGEKERRELVSSRREVIKMVSGFVPEKKEGVQSFCDSYIRGENERVLLTRVAKRKLDPNLKPETRELIEKMWSSRIENDFKYEKGEITKEAHDKINAELNKKLIEESGDKDLESYFKEYTEKQESFKHIVDKVDEAITVISPLPSDKPVEDKGQVQQALTGVTSDSFHMEMHDNGASVLAGPEKFPMEISVFRNDQTHKYVYYIADKYADDGYERVESENVEEALDGRYLDSYISDRLNMLANSNDSPDKIPDKMIVKFGKKLLGDGKSRNYKIESENREVLNAMIKVLELPSVKYPDYYKKVEALNIFFQKEDNVNSLRKRLIAGEKPSLDDLIRG